MNTKPGFIVVGLDQTAGSRAALDFALQEGLARGCPVEIVTAWLWNSPYDGMAATSTVEAAKRVAEALQDSAVRDALDRLPERPIISQTIVHEYAGKALVARAEGAIALVVGSGRKSAIGRAMMGSISEYCVRHAPTPVVVVPDPSRVEHRHHGEIAGATSMGATPR